MNSNLVWIGVILMIVGAIITVITFGIGIICTWPLILVGLIIFILGLVASPGEIKFTQQPIEKKEKPEKSRYCPECGRSIPFDAKICPYCKKDFKD